MFRIGHVELASNLLLSPIAGYCDLAFRLSIRPLGAVGLACTDLVNPRGLLRQTVTSMELVETDPADRPLCIQLYGREPEEMATAAQWCVQNGACIIDINMGCPVDKVCKTNAGSALLLQPEFAARLAERVVHAVNVPVTVKMRLGWNDESLVAPVLARALEDAGVAAITVHGRTAAQKFGGQVRHDGISRVVEAVQRIPVIGNGDVKSPQDAKAMLDRTGCAAVMIGRAALSDPWIFRDTQAYLTTGRIPEPPSLTERVEVMNQHFRHLCRLRGEHRACAVFRQRVSWYVRKLGPCREFHDAARQMQNAAQYWECVERLTIRNAPTRALQSA